MNETEVRRLAAEVLARIAPEADLSTVGDAENLRDALDLDSMDFLNFVIGLHEKTGHPIPEADYSKLQSLAGIVAYLQA